MAFLLSGWSQAAGREPMEYTDQHGRTWFAYGAIGAKLHPVSPMQPRFVAPWYPDVSAFEFVPKKPGQFRINYNALISSGRAGHRAYRDLLMKAAAHFNVPNFDPDEQDPTAQMLHDIGSPPLPLDPILAARAGNGYVLGLRPFDPKKPGDVRIQRALEKWYVTPVSDTEGAEFADADAEFAEFQQASGDILEARPRRGRPRKEALADAG